MPVYIYEMIPQRDDERPERFEIYQSIKSEAIHVHPENGKPVRRIITSGMFIPKKSSISYASSGGDCCGTC